MQSLKRVKRGIVGSVIGLGLFLGVVSLYFNVAKTASVPPGISTPTSFIVTLKKAELQVALHNEYRTVISNSPVAIDVVSNTGKSTAQFSSAEEPFNTYHGVRLTLAGTAMFSGIDPCTGDEVTDLPVPLAETENDEYVMQYEVPHPVLFLPSGAKAYQQFDITADNRITPLEFRIVFPVTNSVKCISDTPSTQQISGTSTGISTPYSLTIDAENDEIGLTNNNTSSITFYRRSDAGDVLPLRTIQGTSTELDGPWGISIYHDPIDPAQDEVIVANSNDAITVYKRTDIGDAPPLRKIQGANTKLNGPGSIYIDSVHDEIGVANGGAGASSITIYDRAANGDVMPLFDIEGSNTELSTPCGIFYDATNDEIVVGNNGNTSITVYSRPDLNGNLDVNGHLIPDNVTPIRTIKGENTGLGNVCNLFVDSKNGEIAAVNNASNTITFYNRLANGNEYPIRTINGAETGLSSPFGLYVDTNKDEIAVSNLGDNSIIFHPRADGFAHQIRTPSLYNPTIEQTLSASYVFSGNFDKVTGEPLPNNEAISYDPDARGFPVARYRGYGIAWKVYNTELRQVNDATNATLIPPSNINFTLADGTNHSTLQIGCASFTPFYLDVLTTNCKTQPAIVSPSPAVDDDYRVAASVLGQTIIQKLHLNITSLKIPELPRLKPQLSLAGNKAILSVSWQYVDAHNIPILNPLLYNQSFSITATQSYGLVSSCYKQVAGNATTLIYSSGSLPPDLRSFSNVKNNNCDILLDDVAQMTFSATDANGNQYSYSWIPR